MAVLNISNEESLYRFLEEHGGNRVKRKLLFFWGSHPDSKFSRYTICYAVDSSKLAVDRALGEMVKTGLVDTHILNDTMFYSLTMNNEKRRLALELGALDWDQWQLMLNRLEQRDNIARILWRNLPRRKK
jgi:hypothetical protein